MFSRRALEARLDVLSLSSAFFESLVFTFWIVILQLRSPSIVATRHWLRIGRLAGSGMQPGPIPTTVLRQSILMEGAGHAPQRSHCSRGSADITCLLRLLVRTLAH